jgi:hypothetical protein
MERRKRIFGIAGALGVLLWVSAVSGVFAQEESSATTDPATVVVSDTTAQTDWKQEFSADKQQIKEQRDSVKTNAEAARSEEKSLRDQIDQAIKAGDPEKAKALREQLKSIHQENVGQKQQDLQGLQESRKEMRSDAQEARQEGVLPPKRDRDNNPPGPKGGPGTNWENKPGPQGGPGASPDQPRRVDRDNNPPGPKGGPGTNWENKPGPQGGPGASPDKRFKRDRDNNPPGPRGGAGTNWENKPGPQGGPGASPDRRGPKK